MRAFAAFRFTWVNEHGHREREPPQDENGGLVTAGLEETRVLTDPYSLLDP